MDGCVKMPPNCLLVVAAAIAVLCHIPRAVHPAPAGSDPTVVPSSQAPTTVAMANSTTSGQNSLKAFAEHQQNVTSMRRPARDPVQTDIRTYMRECGADVPPDPEEVQEEQRKNVTEPPDEEEEDSDEQTPSNNKMARLNMADRNNNNSKKKKKGTYPTSYGNDRGGRKKKKGKRGGEDDCDDDDADSCEDDDHDDEDNSDEDDRDRRGGGKGKKGKGSSSKRDRGRRDLSAMVEQFNRTTSSASDYKKRKSKKRKNRDYDDDDDDGGDDDDDYDDRRNRGGKNKCADRGGGGRNRNRGGGRNNRNKNNNRQHKQGGGGGGSATPGFGSGPFDTGDHYGYPTMTGYGGYGYGGGQQHRGGGSDFNFGGYDGFMRQEREPRKKDEVETVTRVIKRSVDDDKPDCVSQCVFGYMEILDDSRVPSESAMIKYYQEKIANRDKKTKTVRNTRRCFAKLVTTDIDDGCAFSKSLAKCLNLDIDK